MPDAAIALARPVGLRVVDFFQGRFFSFVLLSAVVDMRDAASESRGGTNEALPSACPAPAREGNSVRDAVGDSTMGVMIILPFSPCPESRVVSGTVAERAWLALTLRDRFEEECRTSCVLSSSGLGMVDDVLLLSRCSSSGGAVAVDGVTGREREVGAGGFEDACDDAEAAVGVGRGVVSKSEVCEAVTDVVREPDKSPASFSTSLICRSEVSAKLVSE